MSTTQQVITTDITARLAEAKPITALFSKFDSRGYDAYEGVAPLLFDALDGTDARWHATLGDALFALTELAEAAQWLNPVEGAQVEAQITALRDQHAAQA